MTTRNEDETVTFDVPEPTWSTVTTALGILRRTLKASPDSFSDVSIGEVNETISAVNTRGDHGITADVDRLTVLWSAASEFKFHEGSNDTGEIKRFEAALVGADEEIKSESPVADGGGGWGYGDAVRDRADGPETIADGGIVETPDRDHWGQSVEIYDDPTPGAGDRCECRICGERLNVSLIGGTDPDAESDRWEEIYRCPCGSVGKLRVNGADRRWVGMIGRPESGETLITDGGMPPGESDFAHGPPAPDGGESSPVLDFCGRLLEFECVANYDACGGEVEVITMGKREKAPADVLMAAVENGFEIKGDVDDGVFHQIGLGVYQTHYIFEYTGFSDVGMVPEDHPYGNGPELPYDELPDRMNPDMELIGSGSARVVPGVDDGDGEDDGAWWE